ncbi:modulator of DNA gyrase [Synechococcus sp. NOUM97013]|nr:modulator of DNA gyrase [Synechococcus sp. NOUM97013]
MQTSNLNVMALFSDLNPGHSPWRQRLDTLLNFGARSGADLVEIFLERTDHLGVLAEQDKITSVSPAFGMGAGIRVFRGGQDGFVSTNDLSDQGLHQALEQALAML